MEFGDSVERINKAITDAVIGAVLQYIPRTKGIAAGRKGCQIEMSIVISQGKSRKRPRGLL